MTADVEVYSDPSIENGVQFIGRGHSFLFEITPTSEGIYFSDRAVLTESAPRDWITVSCFDSTLIPKLVNEIN